MASGRYWRGQPNAPAGRRGLGQPDWAAVTVAEDRAADRRMALAVAVLVVLEVAEATLADSGTIGLVTWLVMAVGSVLAVATAAAWHQRRPPT